MKSFYNKTVRNENGCWHWIGASSGRYGLMQFMGRLRGAHVVSYTIHIGEVPKGKYVLHTCDNGMCVNPEHLFLGTQQVNMADKVLKGRQAVGSNIGIAKLDDISVKEIKSLLATDIYTLTDLADKYMVSRKTIANIRDGKIWRHVNV